MVITEDQLLIWFVRLVTPSGLVIVVVSILFL